MYAKYSFSLMLIAFGALAFGAGLLAPDAWRARVAGWGAPAAVAKRAAVPATPVPAAAPAKAIVASASMQAPSGQVAVPLESLAVPVPAPAKRFYALQAGQFASVDTAHALAAAIRQQGMPSAAPVKAVDQGGKYWYIVPIGPYATLDETRAARATAALRLQLPAALPAMVLPAAPAS